MAAGLISPVSLPLEEAVERDSTGHGHAADRARRARTAGAEAAKAPPAILPYIPLVRAIAIERMPELLDRMNVRFEDLLRRSGLPQVPLDHDTRIKLASVLAGQRRFRDAMEELLEVVRLGRHQQADAARTQLLSLFTLAAADPALVSEYRRKLASALH